MSRNRILMIVFPIIAIILGVTTAFVGPFKNLTIVRIDKSPTTTTTIDTESPIFMTRDCPEDAGFCAEFPSDYETKSTKVQHPASGDTPAHTSYVTEVYPGMETEQYVVEVYEDDPEGKTIKALLANYAEPWWECLEGADIALWICSWHYDKNGVQSVTTEMLVPGAGKLYIVQGSNMSLHNLTYIDEFLRDFELENS